MHIGALLVCSGPSPELEALREHIAGRLDQIPRFRQRIAKPPALLGRPFWVDVPSVEIEHHVRGSEIPAPGGERGLAALVGEIFSRPLDHARPLWQLWLAEGLMDDGFAVVYKAHHALADGIADVQLGALLFDLSPDSDPAERVKTTEQFDPPSATRLTRLALEDLGAGANRMVLGAVNAVRRPAETARRVAEITQAVTAVSRAYLDPAPLAALNCEIGSHRSFAWVSCDLEHMRRASKALGGTLNDAVLALAAGTLRRWLQARRLPVAGVQLKALVPVSIRTREEYAELGNRLAAIRAPLPVSIVHPARRFRAVRDATGRLKHSKQPLGAQIVSRYLPQLNFSTRLFNLLVTNLPGPPMPLYVLGREVEALVPVAFLAERQALAIASLSYNGALHIGLIADLGTHPQAELETIADDLEKSVEELLAVAQAEPEMAKTQARVGLRPAAPPRTNGATVLGR